MIGGDVSIAYEADVDRKYRLKEGSGYDFLTPMIDLFEIGIGGGSVASIDELGLVDVGFESAGPQPGPICYDRGGDRPWERRNSGDTFGEPVIGEADQTTVVVDPEATLSVAPNRDRRIDL